MRFETNLGRIENYSKGKLILQVYLFCMLLTGAILIAIGVFTLAATSKMTGISIPSILIIELLVIGVILGVALHIGNNLALKYNVEASKSINELLSKQNCIHRKALSDNEYPVWGDNTTPMSMFSHLNGGSIATFPIRDASGDTGDFLKVWIYRDTLVAKRLPR